MRTPTRHAVVPVIVGMALHGLGAAGAEEPPVPPGSVEMIAEAELTPERNVSGGKDLVRAERVAIEGMPFDHALRLEVSRKAPTPWAVQVTLPTHGAIAKGDVCLLSFHLRGPARALEAGDARTDAFVQLNQAPHTKLARFTAMGQENWQRFWVPFRASQDLPDGQHNVVFHIGHYPQTLDLAGISLLNFGNRVQLADLPHNRVTYAGREADAQWRNEARARIARLRMAPLRVTVLLPDGTPARGAAVEVSMTRHAFGFGSAVTAQLLTADSEDGRRYREVVENLYNKVVFENDLKWGPWNVGRSNTHSAYRRDYVEGALTWLREREIAVRGHYVSWAPLRAEQIKTYTGKPDALRRDLWEHMQEKLPAIGDRVAEWDVVNHIAGWGTRIADVMGSDHVYAEITRHARELAPGVEMWINEGGILPRGDRRDEYERLARLLVEAGAAPDGIGFMGHFGASSLTPPEEILQVMDRFAAIVPRLQLTEFDVGVGPDPDLQADYLGDVMTAAFSHPAVVGIVMWGFWEGRHWRRDDLAHLYTQDWQIRPAGQRWRDLVFREWWTNETLRTDAAGDVRTRVFRGSYSIVASLPDGRAAHWEGSVGEAEAGVVLRLP